jgi:hypothetical protein
MSLIPSPSASSDLWPPSTKEKGKGIFLLRRREAGKNYCFEQFENIIYYQ